MRIVYNYICMNLCQMTRTKENDIYNYKLQELLCIENVTYLAREKELSHFLIVQAGASIGGSEVDNAPKRLVFFAKFPITSLEAKSSSHFSRASMYLLRAAYATD